jgi:Ca2+-binding EF-hand superfamily protein
MNRNLILAAALLALSPAALFAAEGDAPDDAAREGRSAREGEMFKRLDTNHDGVLTKDELQAKGAQRVAQSFDKLDRDKDGMITQDEMKEARTTRMAAMKEHAEERFKTADKNGDGSLSKEEATASMPRLAQRFDSLDQNKDGQLSSDELRAAGQGRHRGGDRPTP